MSPTIDLLKQSLNRRRAFRVGVGAVIAGALPATVVASATPAVTLTPEQSALIASDWGEWAEILAAGGLVSAGGLKYVSLVDLKAADVIPNDPEATAAIARLKRDLAETVAQIARLTRLGDPDAAALGRATAYINNQPHVVARRQKLDQELAASAARYCTRS